MLWNNKMDIEFKDYKKRQLKNLRQVKDSLCVPEGTIEKLIGGNNG